jgi:hypothetical protein
VKVKSYKVFLERCSSLRRPDSQEELVAFEFYMETDHFCFMILSPGAAHSPKKIPNTVKVAM